MKQIFNLRLLAILFAFVAFTGCDSDDDAPPMENLPEVFTDVTLTFTPVGGGAVVTATANDPDGEGPSDLIVQGPINLAANTSYNLTFNVENTLDPGSDLNGEIKDEDNEHQIFFAFTDGAFTSPTGDGNLGAGNADDPINYDDMDENGLDVGLETSWTTGAASMTALSFTANLQHQPNVKDPDSDSTDGDTDFFLTFVLNIN